jgi:hypothetical protein
MMIFDASNRDECQTSRYRTNTPLQALVMLNDPTMIEASKALADRLLQAGTNPSQIIASAFQRIICRTPDAKEKEVLVSYWEQAVAELRKNPENARKIISVGNYQAVTKDTILLAAAMQAIQVMYNMQEAITKT